MRKRFVAVLAALTAAFAVGASASTTPTAQAHQMSCWHAQTVAGHPNAHCYLGHTVGGHDHDVLLYFPWRSCEEYVAWTGWAFWHVNVNHCPGWH
jgi:hypothetical protein